MSDTPPGDDKIIRAELSGMQWQPIETAPKDGTRVLVKGHWDKTAAPHCQGQPHLCIGHYGTFMSNGTGYHWIYEGSLGNLTPRNIAVEFTHWMPLPTSPHK